MVTTFKIKGSAYQTKQIDLVKTTAFARDQKTPKVAGRFFGER